MNIGSIDPNFLAGTGLQVEEYDWYDALNAPFEIRGLAVAGNGTYRRVPKDVSKKVSEGVDQLSDHTAGGRIRFFTNAKRIAVRVKPFGPFFMPHMPLTGIGGADIYLNGKFSGGFRPADGSDNWYEGFIYNAEGEAEAEINLPLYNGVRVFLIGLEKGALVKAPRPYKYEKPVVYYGSSITQGGCASRPGNSYQGHLTRWLDADQINLGFSGNGKGEQVMADYIASLSMSAFVMDYDHNAPNAEHLLNTHERLFKTVRASHPRLPIIIVTKPDCDKNYADYQLRRDAIYKTYENAVNAGDDRVWFIDGKKLFQANDRDACTVDGCHPNDLGFYRMAETIYPVLKEALEKC